MSLSLVIPTYNERRNIIPLLEKVTAVLDTTAQSYEIIIVDDDSPDGTWQVAEELAEENPYLRAIRRRGGRGLATAVVAGWGAAKGEILGVMDGDLQHPPETLAELLDAMDKDADIAVASRHVSGGGVSEWHLIRRCISWGGSILATLLLPGILSRVRDPMSGYFLMKRSVVKGINLTPKGYKILLEVLAKGRYHSIAEVPYVFQERKEGGSKLGLREYRDFCLHLGRLAWEKQGIKRPETLPHHFVHAAEEQPNPQDYPRNRGDRINREASTSHPRVRS